MSRISRKQKLVSEINITPFTDVILVLLVIFMISTPLIYQSSIKIKLPEAKSAEPESNNEQPKVYVTVTNEGILYIDKEVVTRKELKQKIALLHKKNSEMGVILRADQSVRFKDVVEILDILSELNITKLDISAISKE